MPELPEIESVKLQLQKYLIGHKIENVEIRNPKIFEGKPSDVVGAKVSSIRRFAKILSIDLSNGNSLVIHVKLTGQIIYRGPNLKAPNVLSKKVVGGIPGPHTHVTFKLDKGGMFYYNDIRRFGWIKVIKTSNVEKTGFVAKLGPEPFGKLNWLSQIDPKRSAQSLSAKEVGSLYAAIHKVLKSGLKYGGASELAFVTPDGLEGEYQKHTLVYGHEGQPCERCHKAKITKYFLSGRGTYVCEVCQK